MAWEGGLWEEEEEGEGGATSVRPPWSDAHKEHNGGVNNLLPLACLIY